MPSEYCPNHPFLCYSSVSSSEGSIRDGDYADGPGEFSLTVQGNRYRYSGQFAETWTSEWFPISKLQYIRDGVVFDGETYWCHLEDRGDTGWFCSANGW